MKGPGLGGLMEGGVEVGSPLFHTVYLPPPVTDVPKDVVRAFSHNKRVGMYLLGRSLGEGSFAKVKEALHLPTGEKVAVKVIDKKRAKADPYVRKNLRREGRLLQLVRHPHVVQLLEVLETEHSYYMVTECCRGGDLMDHIAARKRLDEREVKKFIRQIVSAVDYLHRLGIIHRDLKIENLLLDHNGDIKIIDFGLSNTVKVSTAPEGTAHAQEYLVTQCGSPAYAAPELLNHRKYGLQVDVWSIGVNMYAMLTGTLPFTVDPFNIKTLYNKMMAGHMNPVPDTLSKEGQDILKRFLTAEPDKRLTITEALSHPWLAEGQSKPVERHPFPNRLKTSDLDMDILKHMSENLGFRMSEVIRFVVGNVPSSACATYHMFHRRLQRHRSEQRLKGRALAGEGRQVEATRISLVLQDMTPRVTNHGGPVGKIQRMRRDTVEKETVTARDSNTRDVCSRDVHARRQSQDAGRLGVGVDESIVVREKTFLSSQGHSVEDLLGDAKENRERSASRSTSKHTLPSPPGTGNSALHASPRIGSPGKMAAGRWGHQQAGCRPGPHRHGQHVTTATPTLTPSNMLVGESRRGRVLVPLAKSLSPTQHMPGTRVQGHTGSGLDRGMGVGAESPRTDGARLLRATGHTPIQPAITRLSNGQWRTAKHTHGEVILTHGQQEVTWGQQGVKDVHSKRPVSPPIVPLVRRRLAKRSRQDNLQYEMTSHGGTGGESADQTFTVERLVTSPDGRAGSRTVGSQSGPGTPARDLHTLPSLKH